MHPKNASHINAQLPSPLLQLPPELRNTIYRYALLQTGDTRIQLADLRPVALLSSCRRIRYEAAPIYFCENRFVLTVTVPPMAFDPSRRDPRIYRVFIPRWIRTVEDDTPLQMRDVKVEIDHAFKYVVITMGQGGDLCGGRLEIVEAWLHNGRQKLPLGNMYERAKVFVDWTMEQKTEGVEQECAGLNYRDVVLVAAKMLPQWAGTIVPV